MRTWRPGRSSGIQQTVWGPVRGLYKAPERTTQEVRVNSGLLLSDENHQTYSTTDVMQVPPSLSLTVTLMTTFSGTEIRSSFNPGRGLADKSRYFLTQSFVPMLSVVGLWLPEPGEPEITLLASQLYKAERSEQRSFGQRKLGWKMWVDYYSRQKQDWNYIKSNPWKQELTKCFLHVSLTDKNKTIMWRTNLLIHVLIQSLTNDLQNHSL